MQPYLEDVKILLYQSQAEGVRLVRIGARKLFEFRGDASSVVHKSSADHRNSEDQGQNNSSASHLVLCNVIATKESW